MKQCTKCKETKELSEYFKRGDNPNGKEKYRSVCKPCHWSKAKARANIAKTFPKNTTKECIVCNKDKKYN